MSEVEEKPDEREAHVEKELRRLDAKIGVVREIARLLLCIEDMEDRIDVLASVRDLTIRHSPMDPGDIE